MSGRRDDGGDGAVVLRLAAAEGRAVAIDAVDAADLADRHDQMLRLAEAFEESGAQLREWAALAREVVVHPDVSSTAPLSPATWARAEEEVRALTTGPQGLLDRSIELAADAVVLRATVETYRWIDDLQATAHRTLGSISERAEGYVAPHVSLGGALVAAGLIETDALERDDVATYLHELAAEIPELMDHVATGGGLVDSLQVRGLLTVGLLGGETGRSAGTGGLRAAGIAPFDGGWGSALRDVALDLDTTITRRSPTGPDEPSRDRPSATAAPDGLAALLALQLDDAADPVRTVQVGAGRLLALVGRAAPAGRSRRAGRLQLVSGDHSAPAELVAATVAAAARALGQEGGEGGEGEVRVLLVGHGTGGATAIEAAAHLADDDRVVVDHVVTANARATHLAAAHGAAPVLSLEDHSDPVALLGSLLSASDEHRLTVVYDASAAPDLPPPVAGGTAADRSSHPALLALLGHWRALGFLRAH
ncbi:hypothetical protein ACFQ0K_10400 [Nocardioides caeni]|uniref:Uncharacterized protein n=1 Tax=Nocardioides caeni TaxID=574700 RepID=A0A4V4HJ75_9ACTN|nr:hypothetical protein [Nocardioides caeni]THV09316.1 hypothetical protein E9934_16370 [Nocardioides caeni]